MTIKETKLQEKIKELKKSNQLPFSRSHLFVDANGNLSNGKPLDYRAEATTEENVIKGYLLVWGVMDSHRTVFLKGCCAKSIGERGPDSSAKQKIHFLWQHDMRDPIGQFRVLKEDDYGLYFEAIVDDVPNGIRALKQVRSGTLNGFSIGFGYIWEKMEYDEDMDAIMIREIDLGEGSIVTAPSQSETYAVRSTEEFEDDKVDLCDDIDSFIKSLPRNLRMDARELFTRQRTLSSYEPPKPAAPALVKEVQPNADAIDYGYLSQNLKF